MPATGPNTLFTAMALIAIFYFGRDVFVPIALAVILSFVLAPLVRRLRRFGLPRAPAVLISVVVAFAIILALGGVLTRQATLLAGNLPQYETTIHAKMDSLRGLGTQAAQALAGMLRGISDMRRTPPSARSTPSATPADNADEGPAPIPVEVRQPAATPLQIARDVLGPVVEPLATAGIVIVFVVFILLYREDLRDRFIRLFGSHDLGRATDALNDAAHRLSRYFLTQTSLNVAFGTVTTVALWLIGVPNPLMWGILAGLMRFVPYIGSFIAALFPTALALAVDPGWGMAIWVVIYFAVCEMTLGQVIEPWLYGHTTGLTPIAVLIAATFWTWLWGPIGLLLATPLTVCMVVLGRHVERLEFLDVLLGDNPPLTPEMSFYQRALAGDPDELSHQAELYLKDEPLLAYYDSVAMKGLALAELDFGRGTLDDEQQERIRTVVEGVIDNLDDHADAPSPAPAAPTETPQASESESVPLPTLDASALPPGWQEGTPILCIGGRSPLDDAGAAILAQLLCKHGLRARAERAEATHTSNILQLDVQGVQIVCLSFFATARTSSHARFLVRRLRRRLPNAIVLAGFWNSDLEDAERERLTGVTGADLNATTLWEAVAQCVAAATAPRSKPAARSTDKPQGRVAIAAAD
jgi:predicted PurR-regulated permease PerM